MAAREDYMGEHFAATYKVMPQGEERWRIKPVGLQTHTLHITKAGEPGWQQPHFHPSLIESYLVLGGKLMYVSWTEAVDDIAIGEMSAVDGVFTVMPNHRHNIYTSVGTEFLTWQQGTLTPNPDRNGQDWWAVSAIPPRVQALIDSHHLITF